MQGCIKTIKHLMSLRDMTFSKIVGALEEVGI
jgi:hypothetical protein